MKLLAALLLSGLANSTVFDGRTTTSRCAGDNCDRALRGTGSNDGTKRPILARSDCSTFQTTTITTIVTPVPVHTIFTTMIITSFAIASAATTSSNTGLNPPALKERDDFVAKSIPTYASACSGSARFSSACACAFGSTAFTRTRTVTAPPGTTTITVTRTTTNTLPEPSCTAVALPAGQTCGCQTTVLFNSNVAAPADGLAIVDNFYSCGQQCERLVCCVAYMYRPYDNVSGPGYCFIYYRNVDAGDGIYLFGRRIPDSCAVPACNPV